MVVSETDRDYGASLLSPAGMEDPYRVYRVLRENDPVHWSDTLEMWMVTSYDDVRNLYRSHEQFSSTAANAANFLRLPADVRAQLHLVEIAELTPALDSADPPTHTQHRSLVMSSLNPRRLAPRRDDVARRCAELLDALAAEAEPEVITHFSGPLSYSTILGIFGAPLSFAPLFDQTARARADLKSIGEAGADAAFRYESALSAFRDALESIYDDARSRDDGTIIATLLNSGDGQEPLSPDELFVLLKTFFAAALDNLIFTIAGTVLALLQHPEQLELVRSEPERAAAAYEEAIRWNVPAHVNRRVARVDTEFGGKTIRAGQRLGAFKASANHDPAVWTNPDQYDITRDRNEPENGAMLFGQGIHFCAGAGLARLVGPLAVNVLLDRFPQMRLIDGWAPSWRPIPASRKLIALPLILA